MTSEDEDSNNLVDDPVSHQSCWPDNMQVRNGSSFEVTELRAQLNCWENLPKIQQKLIFMALKKRQYLEALLREARELRSVS